MSKILNKFHKLHDPRNCRLLRTIPGIGKILSLVLLYEIHVIDRFPSVGDFLSYARLVTPKQTSDCKVTGHGGGKIGNVHLKWAFSEAVLWMLRYSEDAKAFLKRKEIRIISNTPVRSKEIKKAKINGIGVRALS